MANETRYYDTPYTFISPVRHFKSNDPYYYEVDNIPIKQLEESQKFLKDQVDGIITRQNNKKEIEIDRSGFSELKPYATGNDRKVRVKPGKFTARINNAYDLTPLQVVKQITGFSNTSNSNGTVSDLNTYEVETNIGTYVTTVLQQFQDGLQGDALNMNGLAERSFTHPLWDDDGLFLGRDATLFPRTEGTTSPGYGQFDGDLDPDSRPLYPNYIGAILKHSTPELTRDLQLIKGVYTAELQAGQQGRLESEFIKRWRGAIRTSIVDVPEELVIPVPEFDGDDYFYTDANGDNQPLAANHRIDLLFIYSKAVDEGSTTISKFNPNGDPTTLTRPTLGILKGAGIGISRQTATNDDNADDRVNLTTLDGMPIMLAHPGDEGGSDTGFSVVSGTGVGTIKGSFPSPDDLMNLAPVLSENLETTAFQLIGQSILPIAYIRVQTAAGAIADLITEEDIIDIRPFFRTTELAYNERAGIAAATPQVSIANPVVTEAHLETVRKEVYTSLLNEIGNATAAAATPVTPVSEIGPEVSRVIAAGTVTGGWWGPEGALMRHAANNIGGGLDNYNLNSLTDDVETEFSYPAGSIAAYPSWDKARWHTKGSYIGNHINDCINVGLGWCTGWYTGNKWWKGKSLPPFNGQLPGSLGGNNTVAEIYATDPDTNALQGWGTGNRGTGVPYTLPNLTTADTAAVQNLRPFTQMYFVSKRIMLNFDSTSWVDDYHVNVDLLNCIPINTGSSNGQSSNIWVNKYKDYFVINVAWVADDWPVMGAAFGPWMSRNNPLRYTGFTLPTMSVKGSSPFREVGARVITFPNNISNHDRRQGYFDGVVNKGVNANDPNFANVDWLNSLHPLVYPSITFQVIGLPNAVVQNGNGAGGALMRQRDPTITCV